MADPKPGDAEPQPGEMVPAAGLTPAGLTPAASSGAASRSEPTRAERDGGEVSTMDAPVRWSGSAAVPPPAGKRAWWSRRAPGSVPAPPAPPRHEPDPTTVDPEDWSAMPAVDPWADQDTPWHLGAPEILPPTRVDRPVPVNRVPIAPRPPTARPAPPPRPVPQARRPAGRPDPPPRRRRRWPRNLALFTLLSLVCCCGVPAYYAWPAARQYPVTAVLPSSVADLNLRDDSASRRAVEKLTQDLKDTNSSVDDVFAGIYSDGDGKRVTLFGATGLRLTPESDINSELQHLSSTYEIRDVQPFDLGEAGAHERCGIGDASGKSVVVCAWADHGSLATVLLTRRSVADSARLVGILRSAVLTRG